MGYRNLRQCVDDLRASGQLARVDVEVDAYLEVAAIQRRVFQAGGPALLFTRVRKTRFPLLANIFGTRQRLLYLFRDSLPALEAVLAARADPTAALTRPWHLLSTLPGLWHMLPKLHRRSAAHVPVLQCRCTLAELPQIVSWPGDGGPFITLPLVYTENPDHPGVAASNLGMYRVQLSGNDYANDEVGLHYQIHRGLGIHHARALALGRPLPVHIYVGGPPCLTIAAVMPLPEGMAELRFAGLLGGMRMQLAHVHGWPLPLLEEADFCISGHILPQCKPEGPFGDHMGYYSLRHPFPVLQVKTITHRRDAIWPFTTVGRPPQEDTVFGTCIHQWTSDLVPQVFPGVREVHAVDAAGVHPLLLAVGSERYTPYEDQRCPRELLTIGLHLLGTTQTALAKYVLLAAHEDAPNLTARDVSAFLRHILERTDFANDLHFITHSTTDTLDYTGSSLNVGSKLIWASTGLPRRQLGRELTGAAADVPSLPQGFGDLHVAGQGLLTLSAPRHIMERDTPDTAMEALAQALSRWPGRSTFPLVVAVDDAKACAASLDNFLWMTFTRSNPAVDIYGANATWQAKHWACEEPLIIDARLKSFHAPPLEEDPAVITRVEALAAPGKPLHGLF